MTRVLERMTMNYFNKYVFQLIKKKKSFEVCITAYTKRIKEDKKTVIFSSNFDGDNFYLLPLINKVRNDARNYLLKNKIEDESRVDFFNLINNPITKKVVCKVDLNGAYWNYALKTGIISKETDEFLNKTHAELSYSDLKSSRLKALGSLATRKIMYKFVDGIEIEDERDFTVENTRSLYIDICRGIDNLMKECCRKVDGCIYYYWDCIFVDKEFSDEVVEFMKNQKYDVKIKETQLDVVSVGDNSYILSRADEKMYLIRKEDKHLLYETN